MSVPEDPLQQLLADAAEGWAKLPVTEDGADLALAYVRAAYGRGYMDGLDERHDDRDQS